MTSQANAQHNVHHIPSLDGLRGLAILLVLAWHYFGFVPLFQFGWSGVDLFFVLSGYLITGRLLAYSNQPGYFKVFYRNRILRIFPLYYAVLIIFFAALLYAVREETVEALSFYIHHWKSFFIFTENWSFINNGIPKAPHLLHLWSLAVEEQFYLVWPLFLFIVRNKRARLISFLIILLAVLVLRCFIFSLHPQLEQGVHYYFNTFCRIDSFVIGAMLYYLHYTNTSIPARLINLLLLVSFGVIAGSWALLKNTDPSNPFFGTAGYTFMALLYACLLHKTIQPGSFFQRLFSAASLRYCGKISYGLYVFHFIVLVICEKKFTDWGLAHLSWNASAIHIASVFLCLIISFGVSAVSFRYYESFFLRLKKR